MSNRTPGERWHVQHMSGTYPDQYVYIGGQRVDEHGNRSHYCVGQIDVCHNTESARREAYRKGHLASAAPEMLAACKEMLLALARIEADQHPELFNEIQDLRAAIAKAEGN